MSREEIEQVEKELDAVLEMVQRPVPVKNTDSREETASLQENDPVQTKRKTEKEPEMQKKIENTNTTSDNMTLVCILFCEDAFKGVQVFCKCLLFVQKRKSRPTSAFSCNMI